MIEQATIEKLKAENPTGLFLIKHAGVEAVFKRPTREIFRRFKAAAADPARRLDAPERLVYDCLVFPAGPAFTALVELQPALVETFAGELLEIAGQAKEAEVVPL